MTKLPRSGEIRETQFEEALGERYLAYALSTITARSLPDVRDGLKPVHRRLLFAMRQLRLGPTSSFKKCARIVGDVIGKYHPHGDVAAYDALVRLAQPFSVRYPLIEGQGNFGNIDGDNAAAMRYTEARLTSAAEALLEGIDEDAVDFRTTYDGSEEEPVVLPAAFPNLLANGASGIAVGMATSIPPHNVSELCDALLHLIRHPKATIGKLLDLVPGPDFPTGGVLVESREALEEAYGTGRGSLRLRGRWKIEKQERGAWLIVVTEMPYGVPKARLIERIAELLGAKKLGLLADVRDESAEDIRLVLEPRSRNVEPEVLMESLFRQTDLEVRIGLNMNVLEGGRNPRVVNLREALIAFLDHRMEGLKRRTSYRLEKIARRIEVLEGYLHVYVHLDEVIRVIREDDDPKATMMRRWKLSDRQVEAILEMRLRALRRLDEVAIRKEHRALKEEGKELRLLLKDEKQRWKAIGAEIAVIRKRFGAATKEGRRRTEIAGPPVVLDVPAEAIVEKESVTVLCSEKGWLRAVRARANGTAEVRYKEGDKAKFVVPAETTDRLLVFATNGRFYTLPVDRLPGGRGYGEPLRLMIELANDHDIVALFVHRPGRRLLIAASDGRGFVVEEDAVIAQTRTGRQVLNVSGDGEAAICTPADGDHIAVVGKNRKLLVFPIEETPVLARGRGVILQRFRDGGLADAKVFVLSEGLSWRIGERTRTETNLTPWLGKRAQTGRLPPRGFPKSNRFG
jgi:topoisomerase-4 subunit A